MESYVAFIFNFFENNAVIFGFSRDYDLVEVFGSSSNESDTTNIDVLQ
jgi:hypothetical protein